MAMTSRQIKDRIKELNSLINAWTVKSSTDNRADDMIRGFEDEIKRLKEELKSINEEQDR